MAAAAPASFASETRDVCDIPSKHDVLLSSLKKFYACPARLRVLTEVLRQPGKGTSRVSRVSLRILDWLVTNYAKKQNIVYLVSGEDGLPTTFNMFLEYKSQLKAYSKKYFDPFCRRDRLTFEDADGEPFQTTVGQLNFFKWAIMNGVVDFGAEHCVSIEDDMLASIRHRTAAAPSATPSGTTRKCHKPKRRELSKAAIKGCTKTHVTVTVRFH